MLPVLRFGASSEELNSGEQPDDVAQNVAPISAHSGGKVARSRGEKPSQDAANYHGKGNPHQKESDNSGYVAHSRCSSRVLRLQLGIYIYRLSTSVESTIWRSVQFCEFLATRTLVFSSVRYHTASTEFLNFKRTWMLLVAP